MQSIAAFNKKDACACGGLAWFSLVRHAAGWGLASWHLHSSGRALAEVAIAQQVLQCHDKMEAALVQGPCLPSSHTCPTLQATRRPAYEQNL